MSNISTTFKKLPRTFWVANSIELIERWAWYGFFMLFANYLTKSTDLGGLQFSQTDKGIIMGIGTGILYFLPVITGAIADKYGYKKVLYIAFSVYTTAFIFLPMFHSFTGVFAMYLYLALGAALFKPVVSATVAKTTDDETASIGFGIFYLMVNLGAFFGPMVTLLFQKASYNMVFHISAGIIALNFILLFFYKEPGKREKTKETLGQSLGKVFKNIGLVLKDYKFVIFLLIVAGFWTMYNQLFFTLPVFIGQWVDTQTLYHFFSQYVPFVSANYSHGNQIDPEFLTNLDALFIIIFQIVISSFVMRWKPLGTMVTGFIISSFGMALSLLTQNVMFTVIAIFVFSVGEMTASPKITEYIGRIAPHDKKALYMGYSFIPVFIGNIFAGVIAGPVYQNMSDRHTLLVREVAARGLHLPANLTHHQFFLHAAAKMNLSPNALKTLLWQQYDPSHIWVVIFSIGIGAALLLWIYNRFIV